MKKLMLLVFVLFCTSAVANPVNDTVSSITNWASEQKTKTIEYQKDSWADGKAQIAKNWLQIKNLFNWTK